MTKERYHKQKSTGFAAFADAASGDAWKFAGVSTKRTTFGAYPLRETPRLFSWLISGSIGTLCA
jgi:hypothetical protein